MCVCMYSCMLGAWESQKRALASLKLEMQMAVSCHACSGNQTPSSTKVPSALHPWAISPTLWNCHFSALCEMPRNNYLCNMMGEGQSMTVYMLWLEGVLVSFLSTGNRLESPRKETRSWGTASTSLPLYMAVRHSTPHILNIFLSFLVSFCSKHYTFIKLLNTHSMHTPHNLFLNILWQV